MHAIAKAESESTLDKLLAPLMMFLCKLVTGNNGTCERLCEWLLPANLDRTVVFESCADMPGRLLCLLTSVHHSRLNVTSGNYSTWCATMMVHPSPFPLTALSNHAFVFTYGILLDFSHNAHLASGLQYGNVAAFLFKRGVVTGPLWRRSGPC